MRFPILLKFFLSFLITGILLVGLMIYAMQFYTFQNFGEYVDQIELNKLSGLVDQLSLSYEKNQSWAFLRNNHDAWSRLFIDSGLLDARNLKSRPHPGRMPPPGMPPGPPPGPLSGQPNPPALPIVQEPRPLEVGPRLSLFDKKYRRVMGRARSSEGHLFKPIIFQDEIVGYLGLKKIDNLSIRNILM